VNSLIKIRAAAASKDEEGGERRREEREKLPLSPHSKSGGTREENRERERQREDARRSR
jgi:hypothetical protein